MNWKNVGKWALRAAPIVAAPFTGGLSLAAMGAGSGFLDGMLSGKGVKGSLLNAGMGAIPIPGIGGGASGLAKGAIRPGLTAGLKQVGTNVAKSAATNFGAGAGASLLTGGGVKGALNAGAQSTLSGAGTPGTGGFRSALTTGARNAATSLAPQVAGGLINRASGGGGGDVYSDFGTDPSSRGFAPTTQRGSFGGYLPQQLPTGINGPIRGAATPGPGGLPSTTGPNQPTGPVGSGGSGRVANGTVPGVTPPADQQSAGAQGFWDKYGSTIGQIGTQVGGAAIGAYAGKKATEMAAQRSPEELAALQGQTQIAGQAGGLATDLAGQGKQYLQGPANYYQTLLSGNRAAMSGAVAPAVAQITGNYRGANRALEHSGLRGAARDNATADLNRQRVSQIAGLTTGVQGTAADKLAGLGNDTLSQASGLMGTAGNIYTNMLGQGAANRVYSRNEGGKTAEAIGGLARDAGEVVFKKGQAPVPDKPRAAGQPAPVPGQPRPPVGIAPTAPQGPGVPQAPPAVNPQVQPRVPRRPYGNGDWGGGNVVFG